MCYIVNTFASMRLLSFTLLAKIFGLYILPLILSFVVYISAYMCDFLCFVLLYKIFSCRYPISSIRFNSLFF